MGTPVVSAFNVTSSSRDLPTAAHTPGRHVQADNKADGGTSRRKQLRMFTGGCIVLVAVVVGCAVGLTGGTTSSNGDAASSSSDPISVTTPAAHPTPDPQQPGALPHNATSNTTSTPPSALSYVLPPAISTPAPTPAPTTTRPRLPYKDTHFDWLNINEWQGDNDVSAAFAKGGFKPSAIEVSTFGLPFQQSPVLRTKQGWAGEKVIYLEWTVYAGSDANIWMLPTALTSQFGDPRWPNCGEYDIFEMFNGDAAIGHTGTTDAFWGGGLTAFGQSTMHMASGGCFAPYYVRQPNVGAQAAQWKVEMNVKIAMAVVFGVDAGGQYIQQIRNPKITRGGADDTVDVSADGGIAADKIYNNANLYWGVAPVGACAAGHNPATGYPFWNPFRLVLQEQYQGRFDVHTVQVFTK
ncbi:hypothetical protein DYB36_007736 [Aphanomyces astaci]|uniref:Neprosin domain-containing protein n=1 Tax=Aphanomyces astaci TaxID=112090 RepID=A0A397B5Y7_APHAT|nr:hypothetical protein DYB36_007736 [Aphanomyces astaci]